MRLFTVVAMAALAAGIYHFQTTRRRATRERVSASGQLERRVRAAIESAVANPGGIDVRVNGGVVTLRGRVRQEERDFVLAAALGAPGVTQVANLLEVEPAAGEIGTLQSGFATGA